MNQDQPMNQALRLARMIDRLEKQGELKARDLSFQFGVSMETIRKDLNLLCMQGLAEKVYGGAVKKRAGIETRLDLRSTHQDQKSLIARAAVSLIKDFNSILLDSGSTCLVCVPCLNALPEKNIFTVSLEAANGLDADVHQVFVLPGRKRDRNHSLTGPWTEKYLRSIHVDVC